MFFYISYSFSIFTGKAFLPSALAFHNHNLRKTTFSQPLKHFILLYV